MSHLSSLNLPISFLFNVRFSICFSMDNCNGPNTLWPASQPKPRSKTGSLLCWSTTLLLPLLLYDCHLKAAISSRPVTSCTWLRCLLKEVRFSQEPTRGSKHNRDTNPRENAWQYWHWVQSEGTESFPSQKPIDEAFHCLRFAGLPEELVNFGSYPAVNSKKLRC